MEVREKLALLEEMLEIDAESLMPETVLKELDNWDSLAMISLIALLDEKFNKKVPGKTIKGFQTVQDIINNMESQNS